MNDLPRQKLRELIAEHGPQLCDDHKSCRSLLRQRCPDHKKEVNLLIDALQEHVADELRTAPTGQPIEPLVTRLAAALQGDLDLSPEDARWAVETWAIALGLMTAPAAPSPPPAPEPPPPAPTPAPAPP